MIKEENDALTCFFLCDRKAPCAVLPMCIKNGGTCKRICDRDHAINKGKKTKFILRIYPFGCDYEEVDEDLIVCEMLRVSMDDLFDFKEIEI